MGPKSTAKCCYMAVLRGWVGSDLTAQEEAMGPRRQKLHGCSPKSKDAGSLQGPGEARNFSPPEPAEGT